MALAVGGAVGLCGTWRAGVAEYCEDRVKGGVKNCQQRKVLIGEGYERVVSPLSPSPQRRLLFERLHFVVSLAHSFATADGIGP